MSTQPIPSPTPLQSRLLPIDAGVIQQVEAQIVDLSRRIEFYITEYSIELLVAKLENDDLHIPDYQREFNWDERRQSRFVESLLMGLPVPFLFFWENPDSGQLEVVDGSQRLRTLQAFVRDALELGDLQQLSLVSGLRFSDLPESRQRKFRNRSIRGIILSEHTDAQSRFDLFERINTSSLKAQAAEIRRGALGGAFTDLVIELAHNDLFRRLAPLPDSARRLRDDEELVTRFFAWGDGLDQYRDRVAPFLWDYTRRRNQDFEEHPALEHEYRERFLETMRFVQRTFPHGFRKNERSGDTPNTRFEAIAVGSYLALKERPDLVVPRALLGNWFDGAQMTRVLRSDGANAVARLSERLLFVKRHLLDVAGGA